MGLAGFEPATSSARGWHPDQARQQPQHRATHGPYYKILRFFLLHVFFFVVITKFLIDI